MISYGVIFLSPGVLSKDLREKVLSNHANGYLFFKWSKNELEKLGYNGTIISSKRSIGFLENITIPPEHLYFTDLKKPEAYLYVQEINSEYVLLKIKYLGKLEKIINELKKEKIILKQKNDEWSIKLIK